MKNRIPYILSFDQIDKTQLAVVGGKGANLGELSKIEGIRVPEGFCISTEAYKESIGNCEEFNSLLEELTILKANDRPGINKTSTKIRKLIEEITIPKHIEDEICSYLKQLGERNAYAVRSSATAEDLPTASFAGQQDTYLNIIGQTAILKHLSKCWASLYTDRAVTYRLQNAFDQRKVHLSVLIQKMILPDVAGVMFTADPISSNRKVLSIDASFGLGEAMVSGLVNPDTYKVSEGKITDKRISAKKLAIYALKEGGTWEQEIDAAKQNIQALNNEQILELEQIGRKIERHFGNPQDVEWCLVESSFYIVQSRPITTLYPVLGGGAKDADGHRNHVYLSVGHAQMMTDPIKPLGLSFFLLMTRAPMHVAGGRLFIDVTDMLASPAGREKLMATAGTDPLVKDALLTVLNREGFITTIPHENPTAATPAGTQILPDPDPKIPADLIQHNQASIDGLKQSILTKSGSGLFDFLLEDIQELKKILFDPESTRVFMSAMEASTWINEKMNDWLGEKNAADTISQSVPNNITSEMGLALLDVADVIRPYPEVIKFLKDVKANNFIDELPGFTGGKEAQEALLIYLDKYGMRCAGEFDLTRTRWIEKPLTLVPLILTNIKNFAPNESHRKFEHGRQEALKKEQYLLEQLRKLSDGKHKARETKLRIDLVRNFIGYREYPKYSMVSRYLIYKQALLKEAGKLLTLNVIHEKEDIFYLTFDELSEVVRTNKLDYGMVHQRKEDYKVYEKLSPPRVITSDGEIITGKYKTEDLPPGAIAGLAVSSGVVEGRARVILKMEEADIEAGDILVTTFTDPSWTPLFVSLKGLVTEVGGLMTHGAVIAREYGLPAVVGVENSTKLIKDGQRIRVNGTDGYVEILC